ncbi:DEAD/DEAH box helicase [Tropicibacter naphthalenivorans]|uniref:ATP-dependent RNA helicase RhlE n=1 Tax=Tropicibacter naphthalenivorans TaxID=441103 RepID=A0A0P1GBQ2_9RHOB|nr:DEAD/DEAH box helicase [Tropicibacter naphthalenivorans]CUH78846.1 ATP-dependent RNA helicase RhlE [Tropicibacter naphthalenivorans]SMC82024.1 ATP-dependent RNA helicase RhlE [Tropicibacter naphthalenivorans]
MDFTELGLPAKLVSNLTEMGLVDPTPIQVKAIPHALEGRDVMGLAQTGTGKTASFGLPMLAQLMRTEGKPAPKTVRGLILAPTRELAKQIADNLMAYAAGTSVRVGLVVGGASLNAQAKRLERGTGLLVATPGRLIDLMERRAVRLDKTQFLVLDEADQMLDLGFIHALRQIAKVLPTERQTMLFSATMPKHMNELAQAYLTDPIRVETAPPGKPADKIRQSVHFIEQGDKARLLVDHLDTHRDQAAVVFARTKHGAEKLMKSLVAKGFAAVSVHGNKSQGQRERAIKAFRAGEMTVLVATDVAARGLDIPDVRYVYNYDLPNVADNYVHRIGRTARAGRDGTAVAFCSPDEMGEFKAIQKLLKKDIDVAGGQPWPGNGNAKALNGGGRGRGGKPGGGGKPNGGGGGRGGQQRRGGGGGNGGGGRKRQRRAA